MKLCGIVAEYNPFHNGHKYQIDKTIKSLDVDGIVAVMSGNFLQRGVPSSFNKWTRAKMATLNGVDLVIELPTLYSTASSEYFALGAISILNSISDISYISFGAESTNMYLFDDISNILNDEPEIYKSYLQDYLKKGLSYPSARSKALSKVLKNKYDEDTLNEFIKNPNNILGIEYIKSLKK